MFRPSGNFSIFSSENTRAPFRSACTMHLVSKKSGQLNVKVTPEQEAFIAQLEKHRITGPELIRGLLDAARDFYRENGWFSFPLTITPDKFQQSSPAPTKATKGKAA